MLFITLLAFSFALPSSAQISSVSRAPDKPLPYNVFEMSVFVDDMRGFVYLSGFTGTAIDGEAYFGSGQDAFVSKHFLNGTRSWARLIGQAGAQFGYSVTVHKASGDVFMVGTTDAAIEGSAYLLNTDIFIAKHSTNGSRLFLSVFGTSRVDFVADARIDVAKQQLELAGQYADAIALMNCFMNNGSIATSNVFPVVGVAYKSVPASSSDDYFITGVTAGQIDTQMGYGGQDVFLSKTNINGTRYWSRIWGNTSQDIGYDLAFGGGLLYVTGNSNGANFNGMTASGSWDIILICSFENGTHAWSRVFGGDAGDYATTVLFYQPSGSVFVFGGSDGGFPGMTTPFTGLILQVDRNGTRMASLFPSFGSFKKAVFDSSFSTAYIADYNGFWLTLDVSSPYVSILPVPSSTLLVSATMSDSATLRVSTTDLPTVHESSPASSSSTSAEPTSSQLTSQSNVATVFAFGAAGCLLLVILVCFAICYCQRVSRPNATKTEKGTSALDSNLQEISFVVNSEIMTGAEMTAGTGTTMVRSNFELSMPGFLNYSNDSFCINKQIAQGGGGVVYVGEAFARRLQVHGKQIVIKSVGKTATSLENLSEWSRCMFQQEVAIMFLFREEKNIAKLLGWSDNPASLLMKYYPYGSLYGWIHGRVSQKTKRNKLSFIMDIASGLAAMHLAGYVHCDLKPHNVLIDRDSFNEFFCVLTDFGITKVVGDSSLQVKGFTVANVRGLSIQYASPEAFWRYRNKSSFEGVPGYSVMKLDIYSLAIVSLEVLTRAQPW